jgi:hypothetical protein
MPQVDQEEFKFPDETDGRATGKEKEPALEIEIEDDTPEEDRGRTPLPKPLVEELEQDELENYDEKVKTKFKQMRKVWHDERREKEAALREQQEAVSLAQRLFEENKQIKNLLATGEKEYVATAQHAAEMELAAAKQALKQAHEEFDADKIVEAQQALQTANFKLLQAKSFKLPALQQEENAVQSRQQAQPEAPRADPRALAWQERNSWFGANKGMTAFALGLHSELEDSGVPVGSDEYYSELDKTIRKRFPDFFGAEDARPASKAKASTVVAPATRSTSSNKIRLRASQVQLAKKLGLTPEQYAREVMKMESQNG